MLLFYRIFLQNDVIEHKSDKITIGNCLFFLLDTQTHVN